MNIKTYEKPVIKFVSLKNEEAIANTCWGHHNKGTVLYCDIPGEGYCSFQIEEGSCALKLINVKYYYGVEDQNGSEADKDQVAALASILENSGGNQGTPYKGEGTTVIIGGPSDKWS